MRQFDLFAVVFFDLRSRNFQPVDEAIELAAFDAEDSGGGDFTPFCEFERSGDDPAFDVIKRGQLVLGVGDGISNNQVEGKRASFNFSIGGQDIGAFHSVGKLADVARPGVADEHFPDRLAECLLRLTIERGLICKEVFGKRNDVFLSLAQRGNFEAHDIQPIIEVGSEFALLDHFVEVSAGRTEDADVDWEYFG